METPLRSQAGNKSIAFRIRKPFFRKKEFAQKSSRSPPATVCPKTLASETVFTEIISKNQKEAFSKSVTAIPPREESIGKRTLPQE